MNIGELDTRIEVLRASKAASSTNQVVKTWTKQFDCWSKRAERAIEEQTLEGKVVSVTMAKFIVRQGLDIRIGDRIYCDGNTYDIQTVQHSDKRGEALYITARQTV